MAYYLVTGGAGFIGSHLVEALTGAGHRVRVLDDLSTGRAENLPPGSELIVSSVTDPMVMHRALEGIDGCFHLAAISSVERTRCDWRRSHETNLSATIGLFEQAHWHQANYDRKIPVVYASSAAVYGETSKMPISEDAQTKPLSPYGADKLGCELHAAVATRLYDISTVGMRFFNVYGPRQDPRSPYSGVISIFCARLLRGEQITIHGDGGQVRDFVFVSDVVEALQLAMEAAGPDPQVLNVCTGVGTTISDLGATIAELCGVPFDVRYVEGRAGDLRQSTGSPEKTANLLGFNAGVALRDGLSATLSSMNLGYSVVDGNKPLVE
jgi:UDP-glucose 4-epimerase